MKEVSKEKKIAVVAVVLIMVLSTGMVAIIAYYETMINGTSSDYWECEYYSLYADYNDLFNEYNDLAERFDELYSPLVSIQNRTIYWRFAQLDGTIFGWSLDMETYLLYASRPDPTGYNYLYNSDSGETYTVKNLSNYITKEPFRKVISDLTVGRTDKEFIQEIVHIKNQLITYSTGLEDEYRWPVETLTEGTGNCGDVSILLASLIKAGEDEEEYGLNVYMWYCDADHMSDPQEVNHAIVGVEYSDGDVALIETTADIYYSHDQIEGWKYKV